MELPWKAGCRLGVLGLAWLLCQPAPAHADKLFPNVKIDAGMNAWFKITTPHKMAMKNLAPWYTYFPVDPSMMGPPAGNLYPTWPSPFPPPQSVPPQQKIMPPAGELMPPAVNGAWQGYPRSPYAGPTAATWPAPAVLPAGYSAATPSYWFAR